MTLKKKENFCYLTKCNYYVYQYCQDSLEVQNLQNASLSVSSHVHPCMCMCAWCVSSRPALVYKS